MRSMSKAIELQGQRLRLPFDQCQWYKLMVNLLEWPRKGSGPLRVLTVGRAEGVIPDFLSRDNVAGLDRAVTDNPLGLLEELSSGRVPGAKGIADRLLEPYKWLLKSKPSLAGGL